MFIDHNYSLFWVYRPTREFFIHMERTEGNKSDFISSASNDSLYKCKIKKDTFIQLDFYAKYFAFFS